MELLGRYLSGNCSDNERIIIEEWVKQSAANQSVYDEYKKVWESANTENNSLHAIDVDLGWEELNRKIDEVEKAEIIHTSKLAFLSKNNFRIWARIAAILVIAFGLYYVFNNVIFKQQVSEVVYAQSENTMQSLVLSDGSEITLNKQSDVSYPEVFTADAREIDFQGEAFFNITPNPEKPFIISSGEVQIKVLGTSFNLFSFPESEEIILYLESGKVLFSSIDLNDGSIIEQLILTPGQKGVFNRTTGLICKSEFTNQNFLAWKSGVIEFEKTPLSEVFDVLEKTYDVKIKSNDSIDEYCLTARFDNETPESIFETIHTIFGIDYKINGQSIQLN